MDDKDAMIDVFKRVDEVIDFVKKRCFKPQRERSGMRRKHTITRKVELQSVVFVTRQDLFFEIAQKEKRGKMVPKTRVPARTFFNERIQNTV